MTITTEEKIIARFVSESNATGDPMRGAYLACMWVRDEVMAVKGEAAAMSAFETAARVITQFIVSGTERAAAEVYGDN